MRSISEHEKANAVSWQKLQRAASSVLYTSGRNSAGGTTATLQRIHAGLGRLHTFAVLIVTMLMRFINRVYTFVRDARSAPTLRARLRSQRAHIDALEAMLERILHERDSAENSARCNEELAANKIAEASEQKRRAGKTVAERDKKIRQAQEREQSLRSALHDTRLRWHVHHAELSERIVSLERDASDSRHRCVKLEAEVESLTALVDQLPSMQSAEELDNAKKELSSLRDEVGKLRNSLSESEDQKRTLQREVDIQTTALESARAQTQQHQMKAEELQQSLNEAQEWKKRVHNLEDELCDIKKQWQKMEEGYDQMKQKASMLEGYCNRLRQEKASAHSSEEISSIKLRSAEQQVDELEKQRREQLSSLQQQMDHELQRYKDSLLSERDHREELQGQIETQRHTVSYLELDCTRLRSERDDAQSKYGQACHTMDELRAELYATIASDAVEKIILETEAELLWESKYHNNTLSYSTEKLKHETGDQLDRLQRTSPARGNELSTDKGMLPTNEKGRSSIISEEGKISNFAPTGDIGETSGDAMLLQEVRELRSSRDNIAAECNVLREENDRMQTELSTRLTIEESQSLIGKMSEEAEARKVAQHELHVRLLGRLRVFARLRGDITEAVVRPISTTGLLVDSEDDQQKYEFDRVFGQDAENSDVFSELERLSQAILDGHNACIAAYGQTGSGKTHTMFGSSSSPGVSLQAIKAIFDKLSSMCIGTTYCVEMAMCEVYGEAAYDLLRTSKREEYSALQIVESQYRNKQTHVQGLQWTKVDCVEDFEKVYSTGASKRTKAATAANASSSRSHAVVFVNASTQNDRLGVPEVSATLHLADLAGNERSKPDTASHHHSTLSKEKDSINKSLTALKSCIHALVHENKHVPFRNSTLTRILKPALSGHAKVAFIVALNPSQSSLSETLDTLKFATSTSKAAKGKAVTSGNHLQHEDATMEKENRTNQRSTYGPPPMNTAAKKDPQQLRSTALVASGRENVKLGG